LQQAKVDFCGKTKVNCNGLFTDITEPLFQTIFLVFASFDKVTGALVSVPFTFIFGVTPVIPVPLIMLAQVLGSKLQAIHSSLTTPFSSTAKSFILVTVAFTY
jgi:hypothetical protein